MLSSVWIPSHFFLNLDCFMSLRMQWAYQSNGSNLLIETAFDYQCHLTLRYRLFKMLKYEKTWWNTDAKRWLVQVRRGLMGLRALVVKWCWTNLQRKYCQWLWAEWWTELWELRQGWSRGKRYSWRTNCTMLPLTTRTRSWVVLRAVTSRVSRRALRFSCTCRTWQPYLRAARLLGSDLRSKGWWGVPSPEEHSRARRMLRGSMCCRGSTAARTGETSANTSLKHYDCYCADAIRLTELWVVSALRR